MRSRRRSRLGALSAAILITIAPTVYGFDGIITPVVHFSIGAIAGGFGAIAYQPFDYVKAQIQTELGNTKYQNGIDCFLQTCQRNPFDLMKGVGVQVTGVAPEKSIKLGVNDILRDFFTHSTMTGSTFPLWCQIMSGGIAGACQVIATSPLEVLKVGMQTSDMTFNEVWNEIGGIQGLFRGCEACIIRDVVFTAICFPLYTYWLESGIDPFIAGAMSGVVACFIATPPDVVKTRILSQDELSKRRQQVLPIKGQSLDDDEVNGSLLSASSSSILTMPGEAATSTSLAATASSNDIINGEAAVTGATKPNIYNDEYFLNGEKGGPVASLAASATTTTTNPFVVAQSIIEREGYKVLFSGAKERCIGAIPRFGITLGMHEWLEHYATTIGLLPTHHL